MNKKYFSFGVVLAIVFGTVLFGCRKGEKGEPGPSGSGSKLSKDGFISGTLEGTKSDESSFDIPFKYEYLKEPSDNFLTVDSDGYKHYNITRYDSTGESYIKLEFRILTYAGQNGSVTEGFGEYATVKTYSKQTGSAIDNFYFGTCYSGSPFIPARVSLTDYYSKNTELELDNLKITSTGNVNFDYSLILDSRDNSSGNNATITGSISVNPYEVVYRTGSPE
jgi:hypothetical protein